MKVIEPRYNGFVIMAGITERQKGRKENDKKDNRQF